MTLKIYEPNKKQPFLEASGTARDLARLARQHERAYGPCVVVIADERCQLLRP